VSNPLVSVVIPCFNGANVIARAVQSVVAQDVSSEIIIVDDGSTDELDRVVKECARQSPVSIRLVWQSNQGPATARNAGLRMAAGRYVCFLDADDAYGPGFFQAALEILEKDATIGAVKCALELVNSHRTCEPWQLSLIEDSVPSNIIARTELARYVWFPEDSAFRGKAAGEDSMFRRCVALVAKIARLEEPFFKYTVTRGSHFDYFLDRTYEEDGKLKFRYQSAEEQDGSFKKAADRHVQRVFEGAATRCAELLQSSIHGAINYARLGALMPPGAGSVPMPDGFLLYSIARSWPGLGAVVELGGLRGLTTRWIAAGCKEGNRGRLLAVDHFMVSVNGAMGNNLGEFRQSLEAAGVADAVEIIAQRPVDCAPRWSAPLRLLVIKSDGSADTTWKTFLAWIKFVEPTGVIVLADIGADAFANGLFRKLVDDNHRFRSLAVTSTLGIVQKLN
jgi:predicted O-methyltransferase YrrM